LSIAIPTKPHHHEWKSSGAERIPELGVANNYLVANPLTLKKALLDEKEPEINTITQVKTLLWAAVRFKTGVMAPYFAGSFFGGLRRENWKGFDTRRSTFCTIPSILMVKSPSFVGGEWWRSSRICASGWTAIGQTVYRAELAQGL